MGDRIGGALVVNKSLSTQRKTLTFYILPWWTSFRQHKEQPIFFNILIFANLTCSRISTGDRESLTVETTGEVLRLGSGDKVAVATVAVHLVIDIKILLHYYTRSRIYIGAGTIFQFEKNAFAFA